MPTGRQDAHHRPPMPTGRQELRSLRCLPAGKAGMSRKMLSKLVSSGCGVVIIRFAMPTGRQATSYERVSAERAILEPFFLWRHVDAKPVALAARGGVVIKKELPFPCAVHRPPVGPIFRRTCLPVGMGGTTLPACR